VQKIFRTRKVSELRHGDSAEREGGRIVAQGDSLQCAEGIACGEGARCGCDQRIHRNPATLVTPSFLGTCISIST
jgi:hypothetical protein